MKKNLHATLIGLSLCAALTFPVVSSAQQQKVKHPHYKLIDLGTFGGPNSNYFSSPVVESVNNRGTVVGEALTGLPDPTCPLDCFIGHAFQWKNGVLTDLGTLPGGTNSVAFWVNEQGLVMGLSENGVIDPVFGPAQIAVVWKDGQIISLGTLGGGLSFGNAMNNRGEVVGVSANTIPDPFSFLGVGTQVRAMLWRDGVMLDLGTLGGPDGWAASVNERGQVTGWALVDSTVNSVTGQPTQHPFLWENGRMMDLGTLGGTLASVGSPQSSNAGGRTLNNRGQIIGTSNLAGDLINHPFLWDEGALTDLGTLGGDNGEAWWINDAGEIVGRADLPGSQIHHAFLWKQGKMIDLGGALGYPCSTAIDINSRGQIIIDTGICGVGGGPGMLWENGKLYDLNSLIASSSGLAVGDVNFINDRGEIAATGDLPNGFQHAILLIPCDGDHPGLAGCDDDAVEAVTEAPVRSAQTTPSSATAGANAKLSPAQRMTQFRSSMSGSNRRFGMSQTSPK